MDKSKIIDTVIEAARDLRDAGAINDQELLAFFQNVEPEQITLTEKQYEWLVKILEAGPQPNDKLRELLAKKSPWEQPQSDVADTKKMGRMIANPLKQT